MKRVLALLLMLLLAAGCARPVEGAPVPAGDAIAVVDPDHIRWMTTFCGVGTKLVEAADSLGFPTTSGDPAELRRQFLEVTAILVNALDEVVADLETLVPAPDPALDPGIEQLVDDLSDSRSTAAAARADVAATSPLTVEVYTAGINRLQGAMRGFERAAASMRALRLPDELVAAGAGVC